MPRSLLLCAALLAVAVPAYANDWSVPANPASGPAEAIGGYSRGCVRGAAALPMRGPGFQVIHPSRKRYFGHPDLIAVLRDLGKKLERAGMRPLPVADLAQPRGGPAPSGHASHQTGLDADLWFRPAPRRMSRRKRETLPHHAVVDIRRKRRTRYWSRRVGKLLRFAAEDPRVNRIFVNPIIKRELCKRTRGDRSWLRKVRPWYGHAAHFHVRLSCPAGSDQCKPQGPLPAGDGCDKLDWWLDDKAQAARRKGQKRYQKAVDSAPKLPPACDAVLVD